MNSNNQSGQFGASRFLIQFPPNPQTFYLSEFVPDDRNRVKSGNLGCVLLGLASLPTVLGLNMLIKSDDKDGMLFAMLILSVSVLAMLSGLILFWTGQNRRPLIREAQWKTVRELSGQVYDVQRVDSVSATHSGTGGAVAVGVLPGVALGRASASATTHSTTEVKWRFYTELGTFDLGDNAYVGWQSAGKPTRLTLITQTA